VVRLLGLKSTLIPIARRQCEVIGCGDTKTATVIDFNFMRIEEVSPFGQLQSYILLNYNCTPQARAIRPAGPRSSGNRAEAALPPSEQFPNAFSLRSSSVGRVNIVKSHPIRDGEGRGNHDEGKSCRDL